MFFFVANVTCLLVRVGLGALDVVLSIPFGGGGGLYFIVVLSVRFLCGSSGVHRCLCLFIVRLVVQSLSLAFGGLLGRRSFLW